MSIPSTPNLGNIITNPAARKAIYGGYGILAFLVAALQVGWSASGAGPEVWLNVTLAVTAFIGGAVGGLGFANVGSTTVESDPTPSDADAKHAATPAD